MLVEQRAGEPMFGARLAQHGIALRAEQSLLLRRRMTDLERQGVARRHTWRRTQQRQSDDRRSAAAKQGSPVDLQIRHVAALRTLILNQRFLHAPGTFPRQRRPMHVAPAHWCISIVGIIR